ncbi:MAG: alpha/beta fold hydrolase [Nonomuraea sp.]|nr:alpha/beta fold hydrolase [Nonomuraea sp.]
MTTHVRLDDGDLFVRQDGPRDAPVLLLVHGSAATVRSWDALVPLLTANHHVIRVDLLGHGRSSEPSAHGYDIQAQARRTGEALDRLGVREVVAAGHSSGGLTVTALAEQRPDLVTGIVLINTGPSLDAFIPQESGAGPAQWPPTDEEIRRFASTGFSTPGYEIPQALVDEVRTMSAQAFAGTQQAARDYLERQALPERLKAVAKPLLVIFGEDDRRWRSSSVAGYRAVPGARVEMLPGVGHSPLLEDPPRTAAPLLAFAATTPGDVQGTRLLPEAHAEDPSPAR